MWSVGHSGSVWNGGMEVPTGQGSIGTWWKEGEGDVCFHVLALRQATNLVCSPPCRIAAHIVSPCMLEAPDD
jgi:hypothetical protein